MAIFDPHRIDTPQPITKTFVTCDYVGDPYGCAKFGAYPSTGELLGTWVKYNFRACDSSSFVTDIWRVNLGLMIIIIIIIIITNIIFIYALF